MDELDVFDADQMVRISLRRVPDWRRSRMTTTSPEASAAPEVKGLTRSGFLTSPSSMPNLANMFQQELMKESAAQQEAGMNKSMSSNSSIDTSLMTSSKSSQPIRSTGSSVMKWLTTNQVGTVASKPVAKTDVDVQQNVNKPAGLTGMVRNFSTSALDSYDRIDLKKMPDKKCGSNRDLNTWAPSVF